MKITEFKIGDMILCYGRSEEHPIYLVSLNPLKGSLKYPCNIEQDGYLLVEWEENWDYPELKHITKFLKIDPRLLTVEYND